MFDPPGTIGGQLAPLGGIETFHGFDKSYIPLGNEIQQRHAKIAVVSGDLHHKAKVCTDHFRFGGLVSFLDLGGKSDFLSGGQEWILRDLAQIELETRVCIFVGHERVELLLILCVRQRPHAMCSKSF